jgi:hypothetical protein
VAAVDPNDDSIQRWVVWHFRYDPERKQRRNVAVAAFDNVNEFNDTVQRLAAQLRDRKERGEPVDPSERIGGTSYEPGHRKLQDNAHLLKRAIKRGVTPPGLDDIDLPSNVSSAQAHRLER